MRLFRETVHGVNARDYSLDQLEAWAPRDMDPVTWLESFEGKQVLVAEESGEIAGFAELEENGRIDRFYCHKCWQRRGVGTRLLTHLERVARDRGLGRLFSDVSITARPFFEQHGFELIRTQEVERRGTRPHNYVMQKFLDTGHLNKR